MPQAESRLIKVVVVVVLCFVVLCYVVLAHGIIVKYTADGRTGILKLCRVTPERESKV